MVGLSEIRTLAAFRKNYSFPYAKTGWSYPPLQYIQYSSLKNKEPKVFSEPMRGNNHSKISTFKLAVLKKDPTAFNILGTKYCGPQNLNNNRSRS